MPPPSSPSALRSSKKIVSRTALIGWLLWHPSCQRNVTTAGVRVAVDHRVGGDLFCL